MPEASTPTAPTAAGSATRIRLAAAAAAKVSVRAKAAGAHPTARGSAPFVAAASGGPGGQRRGGGRAGQGQVEQPRTDESGVSARAASSRPSSRRLRRCRRSPRPDARRRSSRPRTGREARERGDEEEAGPMLLPRKTKFRKQHRCPARPRQGPAAGQLRRLRAQVPRERLGHQPPDRGRPDRHDPPHQARRQRGSTLPGQAGDAKAGRDSHGLRQGLAERWVAVVKPGRVMFELVGVPETSRARPCAWPG